MAGTGRGRAAEVVGTSAAVGAAVAQVLGVGRTVGAALLGPGEVAAASGGGGGGADNGGDGRATESTPRNKY